MNEQYDFNEDEILKKVVEKDTMFKELVVDYVGSQQNPENGEVTVEMIVVTMLNEFPEFLLAIAEENFVRGYQQALADVETSEKRLKELDSFQLEITDPSQKDSSFDE